MKKGRALIFTLVFLLAVAFGSHSPLSAAEPILVGAPLSTAYLYGWASLVALSRVVLGVHFPLDTVAGALLGSSIGWWAVQIIAV